MVYHLFGLSSLMNFAWSLVSSNGALVLFPLFASRTLMLGPASRALAHMFTPWNHEVPVADQDSGPLRGHAVLTNSHVPLLGYELLN